MIQGTVKSYLKRKIFFGLFGWIAAPILIGVAIVIGIIFIFLIISAALFHDPKGMLRTDLIPYYIETSKSSDINWALTMLYTESKFKSLPGEPIGVSDIQQSIEELTVPNGMTLEKHLSLLLGTEKAAKEMIKAAHDFRLVHEPFITDHRFPIHIDETYTFQETYGKVKPGVWDNPHNGVDISASTDTPLFAVTNGKVVKMANSGRGGLSITIQSNTNPNVMYYYAHLNKYEQGISVGDQVTYSDIIAYVGSTGHSTGPHLHFMIFVDGVHIDPTWFLRVWESYDRYYKSNDPAEWEKRDYEPKCLIEQLLKMYIDNQLYRFFTFEEFIDMLDLTPEQLACQGG